MSCWSPVYVPEIETGRHVKNNACTMEIKITWMIRKHIPGRYMYNRVFTGICTLQFNNMYVHLRMPSFFISAYSFGVIHAGCSVSLTSVLSKLLEHIKPYSYIIKSWLQNRIFLRDTISNNYWRPSPKLWQQLTNRYSYIGLLIGFSYGTA